MEASEIFSLQHTSSLLLGIQDLHRHSLLTDLRICCQDGVVDREQPTTLMGWALTEQINV